jgi:radical SAM enzyme (TIGR01210 family)
MWKQDDKGKVVQPDLKALVLSLYREFGPPKSMGERAESEQRPHFFLHRNFLGEQDLAILFNTKRCRFQCRFCALPFKSSKSWIEADDVDAQYRYVLEELKHSLGILQRLTIANEGSVLDETTFPIETLIAIAQSTQALPRVRRLVIETRLQFVSTQVLATLGEVSGKMLDILTGFETHSDDLRQRVLGKSETLAQFLAGLDEVGRANAQLTAYVLYKPDPSMSDGEATEEADASITFLERETRQRGIGLTIRLNPMYVAEGTPLARDIARIPGYQPPALSSVMRVADRWREAGIPVYIGLTSEGLSSQDNTYRAREDFNVQLLKQAILSNGRSIAPHS